MVSSAVSPPPSLAAVKPHIQQCYVSNAWAGDVIDQSTLTTNIMASQATLTVQQATHMTCPSDNSTESIEYEGPDMPATPEAILLGYQTTVASGLQVFYRAFGPTYDSSYTALASVGSATSFNFQIAWITSGCKCFHIKWNSNVNQTWQEGPAIYPSTLGWPGGWEGTGMESAGAVAYAPLDDIGGYTQSKQVSLESNLYADTNGTWHLIYWPYAPVVSSGYANRYYVSPSTSGSTTIANWSNNA